MLENNDNNMENIGNLSVGALVSAGFDFLMKSMESQ